MKVGHLVLAGGLVMTSALALAQGAPESLLPPGFDRPRAAPARPAPSPSPSATTAPRIDAQPVVQAVPSAEATAAAAAPRQITLPGGARLPSIDELRTMTADELTEALKIKPKTDIPPAARRAMKQIGVLDRTEGGFGPLDLAGQPAALVAAALEGNRGLLVSRWGHILLRRALASRLDAPEGMAPADFAAMRAALLVRMGEGEAARALVQDVDTANFTPALTAAAMDAYVATADLTGICPAVAIQGSARDDAKWQGLRAICDAFQGDGQGALARLDRIKPADGIGRIDLLLAQKYAGAAGRARRAVTIEWDGVQEMTPWRYGMTLAVGLEPPPALKARGPLRLDLMAATAPMLGLGSRAAAADRAAGIGILSSAAMVDLYSQIHASDDMAADRASQAEQLRLAYVAQSPAARVAAMKTLWEATPGELQRHSRQVLTAYAAARLPVDEALAGDAAPLIASMLAAGLDRNALRWAPLAPAGSEAWALLALVAPARTSPVEAGAIDSFISDDDSPDRRRSAFLLAGLAGLGRVTPETARAVADQLKVDFTRDSRWSQLIEQAAEARNPALVALLAGLGMQGFGWERMTPRHLYHIVAALNAVGLSAEARMIAAEAVARG